MSHKRGFVYLCSAFPIIGKFIFYVLISVVLFKRIVMDFLYNWHLMFLWCRFVYWNYDIN
jgi:hypothetical protein